MNETIPAARSLTLRRTFKAPRDRVFAAWTQPEMVREWFAPPPGMTVPDLALDVRVGGAYRVVFRADDGEMTEVAGVYREVRPPERLAYTWRFPGWAADTLVVIEFYARGDETDIVLTHRDFADAEACAAHERGWVMSLNNLARTM